MAAVQTIDALFEREYPRLVRSLGAGFGAEAAADAVQEAFIAADRRWGQISRYEDPVGWARRVAVNRLLTARRTMRRRAEILATVRPVAPEDLSAELLDLQRAISSLPPKMRAAVCLHHLGGLTVDEVAEVLSVTPGTVKSNLHDARARLRARLEVEPHA
jgi:RNA polymerase sigma-70 factor (ECF subfamily)